MVFRLSWVLEATFIINGLSKRPLISLLAISRFTSLGLLEILRTHQLRWMDFSNALSELNVGTNLSFTAIIEFGDVLLTSSVAVLEVDEVWRRIKLTTDIQAMKFTQKRWLNVKDICLAGFRGSHMWQRERILILTRLQLAVSSDVAILAQLRVHIDGCLSVHQLLLTSEFELLITHGLCSSAGVMGLGGCHRLPGLWLIIVFDGLDLQLIRNGLGNQISELICVEVSETFWLGVVGCLSLLIDNDGNHERLLILLLPLLLRNLADSRWLRLPFVFHDRDPLLLFGWASTISTLIVHLNWLINIRRLLQAVITILKFPIIFFHVIKNLVKLLDYHLFPESLSLWVNRRSYRPLGWTIHHVLSYCSSNSWFVQTLVLTGC